MIPWPAQLIPAFGLDNTSILLGLFALLAAGLAVLLFILVRAARRRRASGASAAPVEPAQLTAEPPVEVADAPSPTTAPPAAAAPPVLMKLLSAEGQALEPDFARPAAQSPEDEAALNDNEDAPAVARLLVEVEARRHLEQVNQYVLLQYGEIREEPGQVELSWYTNTGPRTISIAPAADERELTINGIPFDATPSGVQKGIVAYLRGPDNRSEPEAI